MKRFITGAAIAALATSSLPANAVSATAYGRSTYTPSLMAGPDDQVLTLNAGVPIKVAVAEDVNSTTHHAGDMFKLTVLEDVRIGDTILIPRGAPAFAEITWRTGKGAFGKSGKLEFSLRYIELDGQRIPLSGSFRQEGEGNTIATGVGVIAIGVFAGFITGKRAKLPVGRELMAQTAQPVMFTANGHLAPSYDGTAATAAAEANDPLAQCKTATTSLPEKKQKKALEKCFSERMD